MIERHIETIFCDDIRQEINGKTSLIGIYGGALYAPLPITLPRLCVVIKVVTPIQRSLELLTLRILKDTEEFQTIEVLKDDLKSLQQRETGPEDDEFGKGYKVERIGTATFNMIFSPLVLDEPCMFRIRAQTENEELRGAGLRVIDAQPSAGH